MTPFEFIFWTNMRGINYVLWAFRTMDTGVYFGFGFTFGVIGAYILIIFILWLEDIIRRRKT